MINVFRPHTYQDVAREIAEGLMSGHVLLERDEAQEDPPPSESTRRPGPSDAGRAGPR